MMGVSTMISEVSCQLMMNKNTRLPMNCTRFLNKMEILSEAALSTTVTSLVSREISSPVLFLS